MKTKKLLGMTLALAMILPSFSQANAELLKNVKLSGQIDVQGTAARNTVGFSTRRISTNLAADSVANRNNDRIGDTETRLLAAIDWDLLDDVHAKVSVAKNDRQWGNPGNQGAAAGPGANGTNGQTIGGPAGSILGNIVVDQAYFKVDKVLGAVDATFGRQYYGTPGDLIIYFGPSDKPQYGLPTSAVDAARFDWSNEMLGVTALAGKINTGAHNIATAAGPFAPGADRDLTGFIATLKGNDTWSGAFYTWNVLTHGLGAVGQDVASGAGSGIPARVDGKNDSLFITGAKIKLKSNGAWFNGEFAKNWGDSRVNGGLVSATGSNAAGLTESSARYKGWAILADVGYKADVSGVGAFTPWGQFGYGTGQHDTHSNEQRGFVAVSGDYRPGSIYGRFAPYGQGVGYNTVLPGLGGNASSVGANLATNTLTNRVIYGLGVRVNPSAVSKLTAGASLWDFHTQTKAVPVRPQSQGLGTAAIAPVAAGQDAFSGNKHIGYEVDVDLTWKHSDNVMFDVGAGRFMPGGIIYEANQATRPGDASAGSNNGVNPARLGYFDVRVKF